MSWEEVGGDGWSWVEVGVWFSNTCFNFIHCVKRDIEIAQLHFEVLSQDDIQKRFWVTY